MPWPNTIRSFGAVVITGGSSGIGAAFVRTLDKIESGPTVFNLSRREIGKIGLKTPIVHLPTDLGNRDSLAASVDTLSGMLRAQGTGPILLINNAGFGNYDRFSAEGHDELGMIDLNVRAVVDLTERLLPLLKERGGAVINVASLAAFQPIPYFATYAATKAFVLHWSLAVDAELRGSGVRMLAVCPGPTESEFFRRAGFSAPSKRLGGQTAEAVVEETFRALHRGRALVVTGWRNRMIACASHCLPKGLLARLAGGAMQRYRLAPRRTGGQA